MKTGYTVRVKLIAAFVVLALIPLGLLAFFNGRTAQQALIDDANQALFAVVSQTAASVDAFISANLTAIETEAQLPALEDYLLMSPVERQDSEAEAEILELLQALTRKDPVHITSYALLDSQGVDVTDTQHTDIGLDKSDRAYFTHFQSETPEVITVTIMVRLAV